MKIAYVCADSGVPSFGTKGCSIHVQEIVKAFLRRGDSVDLFVARTGGDPPPELAACRVREFRLGKTDSVADRELAQQKLAREIAHAVPFQDYDLIYERYSLWSDLTQTLAVAHSTATVLEVNAPLIDEQRNHRELHDRITAESVALNAFGAASSIVSVSAEVADYVTSFFTERTNSPLSTVHVVSNGVDVDRFQPCQSLQDADPTLTIGFVGSLKPWHGVESLIEAFQQFADVVPNSRLRIIGDGPMRSSLENTVDRHLARNIEFVGAVSPNDMPHHLAHLNIAVAPYLKSEGFYFSPLKLYEYMACGLPVIASRSGQIASLIEDGHDGLLYEPGSVEQLSAALHRLAASPSLRQRLGQAARSKVTQQHSWQQCLDRILRPVLCPSV